MPLSAVLLSAAIPFSFVATLAIHRSLLCCSSTALLSIAALQSFSFQALSLAVLMLAFLSLMWPSALLTVARRCSCLRHLASWLSATPLPCGLQLPVWQPSSSHTCHLLLLRLSLLLPALLRSSQPCSISLASLCTSGNSARRGRRL